MCRYAISSIFDELSNWRLHLPPPAAASAWSLSCALRPVLRFGLHLMGPKECSGRSLKSRCSVRHLSLVAWRKTSIAVESQPIEDPGLIPAVHQICGREPGAVIQASHVEHKNECIRICVWEGPQKYTLDDAERACYRQCRPLRKSVRCLHLLAFRV
jgi:hypothetical protein